MLARFACSPIIFLCYLSAPATIPQEVINVAIILAWQRDLHVLHQSQRSVVANFSYLGGSVPTFDIKNIAVSLFNSSVPFLVKT